MPAIMTGASFGALFGLALLTYLPASWDIQPGLYALVGATATLGGVFRGSISLVVVVVEGTRGAYPPPGCWPGGRRGRSACMPACSCCVESTEQRGGMRRTCCLPQASTSCLASSWLWS